MSQAEFAVLGGVQSQAQLHYEKGSRRPNSDYLIAIAAAGVDVQYLITGQPGQPATLVLSTDERQVLAGYKALDTRKQTAIRALIEAMDAVPESMRRKDVP